jgi:phage-related protein
MRSNRTRLLAMLLVFALLMPQPSRAIIPGLDRAPVVIAIGTIATAINNVIGGGLRAINGALNALNGVLNAIQSFFQNVVYPADAIARARGVAGAVRSIYNQIQSLTNLNVASATLTNPRRLEAAALSRDPGRIEQVTNDFRILYQEIPSVQNASPEVRDLIDMTDATAIAAMKRAIAVDAAADQLSQAADQLAAEFGLAAPGTAPMIEAQAAAMLVKAHALTQSAFSEYMRVRAIDIANASAQLKLAASQSAQTRQQMTDLFKK